MYKNVLTSIPGIEVYPIIALMFFFGFFLALLIWYFRVDVAKLNQAAQSAMLDSSDSFDTSNSVSHPKVGVQK